MNYTEEALLFACSGSRLLGILAKPETPACTGVIVIVGGPQYRIGSHRQFVLLSRALAAAGHAVLRFDYRGMGDSDGPVQDFESASADIAAAIDLLQERLPGVKQVVLWGLCDGACAALLYSHDTRDPRVSGMCLLNPWVRSERSLAQTQVKHYYRQRLMQKEFWSKLLQGKVAAAALSELAHNIRLGLSGAGPPARHESAFQQRMATACKQLNGRILLILSGDDYTAKEFLEYAKTDPAWQAALTQANLHRKDLPGADHTFSSKASRRQVEEWTLAWLTALCAPPRASKEGTR